MIVGHYAVQGSSAPSRSEGTQGDERRRDESGGIFQQYRYRSLLCNREKAYDDSSLYEGAGGGECASERATIAQAKKTWMKKESEREREREREREW